MLADQIRADLTTAMKAGDPLRLSVLRMIASEMNYKKIEVQRELTNEDVILVLQKEAKKRREAIQAYGKAGRTDSAQQETQELVMIQKYLPEQMSEDQVREQVLQALSRLSPDQKKDFGSAMRVVSPEFKGKADGSLVAAIVKENLSA